MRTILLIMLGFYALYTINKIIKRITSGSQKRNDLPKRPFTRDDIEDAEFTEIKDSNKKN